MAQSKSFFGIRKGSTKSLTFQKLHGKQVTKDRVSVVKNPQSTPQMRQRLIMPMVANARSSLKGLVDHSFEGTPYGWQSLRKFSALNMRKDALHVTQYVPKGVMDCGEADFIVSQGSLPTVSYTAYYVGNNIYNLFFNVLGNSNYSLSDVTGTPSTEQLKNIFAHVLLPDLQTSLLSFLFSFNAGNYNFVSNNGELTANYHSWLLYRLSYDRIYNDTNLTFFSQNEGNHRGAYVRIYDNLLIHVNLQSYSNTVNGTTHYGYRFSPQSFYNQFDAAITLNSAPIINAAIIYSKFDNGVWKRSTQRCISVNRNPIPASVVLPTYLRAIYSTQSSYFLNNGDKSTGLEGNSGINDI